MSHLNGMKNWITGKMPRLVIMRKLKDLILSVKKINSVTCDVLRLWVNGMSLLKNQPISWQRIAIISIKMGWLYWLMIKQRQDSVRQLSWQQWLLGIGKIGKILNKIWNISQQESFWNPGSVKNWWSFPDWWKSHKNCPCNRNRIGSLFRDKWFWAATFHSFS